MPVRSGTGLTIGVGMGPTKTLAKSAQWASKEWSQFGGMLALTLHNQKRTEKLLSLQPVEEIWGVGRRLSKKLNTMGKAVFPWRKPPQTADSLQQKSDIPAAKLT